MICIGNFKKRSFISVTKAKNLVVFPFTYVSESHAMLNGNFFMNLHSVDSAEAMKQGKETLNASSLQFFTQCWTLHRHYF
jgi:hypothetical protein